jgi:hypothetical protein
MAWIEKLPNGRKLIRYEDGLRRPKISIGRKSMAAARTMLGHIENLLGARESGHGFPPATAAWLAAVPAVLAGRLAELGLCQPRRTDGEITLGGFLKDYFARRDDVKPGTKTRWKQTERNLCDYFGADTSLPAITEGKAHDFRRWLITHEKE